ncbi:5222_t:CDS:1 [Funneliformis geosporum]|nr:5222_t:CDS:1 [Funneliformis geosporum]
MKINPAPLTLQEKGKQFEIAFTLNKRYDENKRFYTSENILDSNNHNNKDIITFARKDNIHLYFAYYAAEKFLPNHPNKEKINSANKIFNRLYLISFIGVSVHIHPENKQTKII